MNTEPKLLTVEMAEALGAMSPEGRVKMLRERGLIAEEPVDPLLVEAREIVVNQNLAKYGDEYHRAYLAAVPKGERDGAVEIQIALAALRRGMELQREKLTVEVVDEALVSTFGDIWQAQAENVHAALTEALQ